MKLFQLVLPVQLSAVERVENECCCTAFAICCCMFNLVFKSLSFNEMNALVGSRGGHKQTQFFAFLPHTSWNFPFYLNL